VLDLQIHSGRIGCCCCTAGGCTVHAAGLPLHTHKRGSPHALTAGAGDGRSEMLRLPDVAPTTAAPAVENGASSRRSGTARQRRRRRAAPRRAKSALEIRAEVRRDLQAGTVKPSRRRRPNHRPKGEGRRSVSVEALSDCSSVGSASLLPSPSELDLSHVSRLSMSSSLLGELDPTAPPKIDGLTGEPEPPTEPRYSDQFLSLLFGATPRDMDPEPAQENNEVASRPRRSIKDAGVPRGPHRPEMPDWWDWDMPDGGIGGRWLDTDEREKAQGGAAAVPAAGPAATATVTQIPKEDDWLHAAVQDAHSRTTLYTTRASTTHRQRLNEISRVVHDGRGGRGGPNTSKGEDATALRLRSVCSGVRLTVEEMAWLKSEIQSRDPEDDGLTLTEFVDFMSSVATDDSAAALRMLFLKMDASSNGLLTCDEFLSYLLHRSSEAEAIEPASLLRSLTEEGDTNDGGEGSNAEVKAQRSAQQHGCMINRVVPIQMSAGNIPMLYATTGRPGLSKKNGGPEHSVVLWRASDLSQQVTLPASTLMPLPSRGVVSDGPAPDAVSFLPMVVGGMREALVESINYDDGAAQASAHRNLLESTARIVDVTNWPGRASLVVLVDNAIMGPFLCVHRHKDILGSATTQIDRIPLQDMGAPPSCFYLCPPHKQQPTSPCPDMFFVGDRAGFVSKYRTDGSRVATAQWHASAVSRVRLVPTRKGVLCRVASIESGEGASIVLADAATWKQVARSAPVALGIRSFDHSPAFSVIVSAGADRKARVWMDDSLTLVAELVGHKAPVVDVVVNERAAHVATGDSARAVRVWDMQTFGCIQQVSDPYPHPPENSFSTMVLDTVSNRLVVAGSYLAVWSAAPCKVEDAPASSIAGPALPGLQGVALDMANRAMAGAHVSKVVSLCYSHRFGQCISMDELGEVYVNEYNSDTGTASRILKFHVAEAHDGALLTASTLDAHGSRIFTGCANGMVRLWNTNSGEQMVEVMSEAEQAEFVVRAISRDTDGQQGDGEAAVVARRRRHKPPKVEVSALRWLAGSHSSSYFHLMATGWGGAVMLWRDPAEPHGRPMRLQLPAGASERGGAPPADVLCGCSSDSFVAVGTADGRILCWFFSNAEFRMSTALPKLIVEMPPMDPAIKSAAEGGADARLRQPNSSPSPAEMLFWLPTGRTMLAIGNGRFHLVSVYSAEVTDAEIAVVPGASVAALSDDGDRLAVGTADGEIVVFDVRSTRAKQPTMPELGRCRLGSASRISSVCFCGRPLLEVPARPTAAASFAHTSQSAVEIAQAQVHTVPWPAPPDWLMCGCADGSVVVCSSDGQQYLGPLTLAMNHI
jgi:WD40 repeat protein/Ca2+-binding EF-hand superfamily protein